MFKKLIILFSLFSQLAFAESCEALYPFTIDGHQKDFCILKDQKVLVSKDCDEKNCDVKNILKSSKAGLTDFSSSELRGGKNPSTLLCKKIEGKLILGISNLGHQQFFCQFNDGSMISASSLYNKLSQLSN